MPVRVRQHVNPLSQKYLRPIELPDWSEVYAHRDRPLHLDIGCGKGDFLLQMAALQPEWNFLGVEIRRPVVDYALQRRDEAGLENLHFLFGNVSVSLRSLLASLPPNALQRVSIQYPDPWFKKRHQKRRVAQPELVAELAEFLPLGGEVVIQSDIEEVAQEMGDRFSEHPAFVRTQEGWLAASPFPAQTERERVTLEKGQPVFRAQFIRQPD
ncbi:tRNA (guanosine(46)-N7)-methyltransferase TrmB [filamentous cyanobacterium CCP5]|nr:tRNA (guanosine(46)-N7)-methyltransferase TrmB [filamentous cyanobacterium CCP5]